MAGLTAGILSPSTEFDQTEIGPCQLPEKGDNVMTDMLFGGLESGIPVVRTLIGNLRGTEENSDVLESAEKFIHFGGRIYTMANGYGGSNYCRTFMMAQ